MWMGNWCLNLCREERKVPGGNHGSKVSRTVTISPGGTVSLWEEHVLSTPLIERPVAKDPFPPPFQPLQMGVGGTWKPLD